MKKVLVTGASGHLGGMLFDHLEQCGEYDVLGLDLRTSDKANIHQADFGEDGPWVEHLKGVDTIVHLAGDREPTAEWDSAIRNNMDATLALYHHANAMGVGRVVLASSNWLQGGRRFSTDRLNSTLAPYPVNAYGMSKLFCERAGAYFAQKHGLSVICLRIGWTQWTHDNQPGPHMAMGRWGQEMWLSDRDYLNGMKASIDAENVRFEVLNLMSDNLGMRWDIEETKQKIGYNPKDNHRAEVGLLTNFKAYAVKVLTQTFPDIAHRHFGSW